MTQTDTVTQTDSSLADMTIPPIGKFQRCPRNPEWMRSAPHPVPYFEELSLPFYVHGIEDDLARGDFEIALGKFLNLGGVDRDHAAPYLFRQYRQYVEAVGQEQLDCIIPSASAIWDFVTPTAIHVSRRHRRDRMIYVEIHAECRWDIEHGLAVIYRSGSTLSRVSDQDGHLTTSDAFHLPEEKNSIIYEG